MKIGLQFGAWLSGLVISAGLLVPCAGAQNRPSQDRPPARQQGPSRQANAPARNDRPSGSYHPQGSRNQNPSGSRNAGRPPANPQYNRPDNRGGNRGSAPNGQRNDRPDANRSLNPNRAQARQQAPAVPPPNVQERMRNLSPQEKTRLAENQRKFNQLSPQRQQEMRQAAANWGRLTPEQRNHLQNEVLPKWQQLPGDRQKAIQQRLGVLRNMPESARNRHLDDPNFTRGMNDDDRQMLRDLSHEHVGAPDQPHDQ
jgi:Protein of unknown function (DUF3106)